MLADTKAQIRELLYRHYEFAECVSEDMRWRNQGAMIDVVLDYIWSDIDGFRFNHTPSVKEGVVRSDLEHPGLKVLRFHLVQELHMHTWLPHQLGLGDHVGWGLSEVAAIRIQQDNLLLSKYRSSPTPLHHITFWWEGDWRIDIVCAAMEVLEGAQETLRTDS